LFRGNTTVNLDEKSRFAIPTRYRDRVREICACQLMATVAVDEKCAGIQGCLWIYPKPEFERVEKEILQLNSSSSVGVKLRRFLIGYASDCEMDSQGRVLIPESLRKIANLDKKAVLVGQINRFEVWNEEEWSKKEAQFLDSTNTEGLAELSNLSF
jgi:MraZ protein